MLSCEEGQLSGCGLEAGMDAFRAARHHQVHPVRKSVASCLASSSQTTILRFFCGVGDPFEPLAAGRSCESSFGGEGGRAAREAGLASGSGVSMGSGEPNVILLAILGAARAGLERMSRDER